MLSIKIAVALAIRPLGFDWRFGCSGRCAIVLLLLRPSDERKGLLDDLSIEAGTVAVLGAPLMVTAVLAPGARRVRFALIAAAGAGDAARL